MHIEPLSQSAPDDSSNLPFHVGSKRHQSKPFIIGKALDLTGLHPPTPPPVTKKVPTPTELVQMLPPRAFEVPANQIPQKKQAGKLKQLLHRITNAVRRVFDPFEGMEDELKEVRHDRHTTDLGFEETQVQSQEMFGNSENIAVQSGDRADLISEEMHKRVTAIDALQEKDLKGLSFLMPGHGRAPDVAGFNAYRKANPEWIPHFSEGHTDSALNIDFGGLNLSGVNFAGAKLDYVNFKGANLSEAIFIEAHINCPFEGAMMFKAILSGAHASHASFKGATLSNTTMQKIIADDASFVGASLRGADLKDAHLQGATFLRAEMDGATLVNADISGAMGITAEQLSTASLKGIICADEGTAKIVKEALALVYNSVKTTTPSHASQHQEPRQPESGYFN